ncbi:MAG TPA: serine/threonine-protein kinase [Candidatus Polarisedimenticolia bacterium]
MEKPKTIGRYEILEEVGRGAMGAVYKARDPRIGRVVALKTIAFAFPLGPGEEEEFLHRFYHEAQIAGRLNHPNIVTIYDVGEKSGDGDAFIAMEFVTGTNLHDLLAGGGRLPLTQVADVIAQLGNALDYAHENGVVHRDVKPANIILTESGQPKILDFGIARLAAGGMTRPGSFFGTPNYMAPEQVTGLEVDGRADQFSLGVILYQLLTGEKPFMGESVTAISYQVVNVDPPPVTKLNPSLLPGFDRVIRRALAKGASGRYTRCADLAEDLREAVTEWKGSTDRKVPATLVSGRAAAGAAPTSPEGGVRGITYLVPRWAAVLARAGSPLGLGWVVFLLCLAMLASAPYLLRRGPAASGASRPLATVTAAPWDGGTVASSDAAAAPGAASTSRLNLVLSHRFKGGHVVVRIDGNKMLDEPIRGGSKGLWTRSLQVPSGRRRIEARVTSSDRTYDDIQGIEAEFRPRQTRQLRMTLGGLSRRLKLKFDEPQAVKTR